MPSARTLRRITALTLVALLLLAPAAGAAPRVIVISLDGATPYLVDQYTAAGALDPALGIGFLSAKGVKAAANATVNPSLTAPGHVAIATGSSAPHNDIPANTFHLVASPLTSSISGFSAPIGGYAIDGPAPSATVTAEPLWMALRAAGKVVVTATFPGGDGLDVRVPGDPAATIVQPSAERTVDFTVPFGAFAGLSARGFALTGADFSAAPAATVKRRGRPRSARCCRRPLPSRRSRWADAPTRSTWPPWTAPTTRPRTTTPSSSSTPPTASSPDPSPLPPPAPPT